MQVLAMLMLIPLLVGLIYRESLIDLRNFVIPIVLSFALGTFLTRTGSSKGIYLPKNHVYYSFLLDDFLIGNTTLSNSKYYQLCRAF